MTSPHPHVIFWFCAGIGFTLLLEGIGVVLMWADNKQKQEYRQQLENEGWHKDSPIRTTP